MAFSIKQPNTHRGVNVADPHYQSLELALDFLEGTGTSLANQGTAADSGSWGPLTITPGGSGAWTTTHRASYDFAGTGSAALTNTSGGDLTYAAGTIVVPFRFGSSTGWQGLFQTMVMSISGHIGAVEAFYNRTNGVGDGDFYVQCRCAGGVKTGTFSGSGIMAPAVDHVLIIRWDASTMTFRLDDGAWTTVTGYTGTSCGIKDTKVMTLGMGGAMLGDTEHAAFYLYSLDILGDYYHCHDWEEALLGDPLIPVRLTPFEAAAPICFKQTSGGATIRLLQERNWGGGDYSQYRVTTADTAGELAAATPRSPVDAGVSGSGTPIVIDDVVTGLAADQVYKIEYNWNAGDSDWIPLGDYSRTDVVAVRNLNLKPSNGADTTAVICSDLHCYGGANLPARIPQFLLALANASPNIVVDLGDKWWMSKNGVTTQDHAYDLVRNTQNAMAGIFKEAPIGFGVGNWEYVSDYTLDTTPAFRTFYRAIHPLFHPTPAAITNAYNWHMRVGLIHVFSICHYVGTNHEGDADGLLDANTDRVMSAAELAGLVAVIDASDAPYKIVASHQLVGGYDAYGRGFLTDINIAGTYMANTLWPAIKDKIQMFVTDHDHVSAYGVLDGVLCVEAGSPNTLLGTRGEDATGNGYDDADYAKHHYGFVKMVATASELTVSFRRSVADSDGVTADDTEMWSRTVQPGAHRDRGDFEGIAMSYELNSLNPVFLVQLVDRYNNPVTGQTGLTVKLSKNQGADTTTVAWVETTDYTLHELTDGESCKGWYKLRQVDSPNVDAVDTEGVCGLSVYKTDYDTASGAVAYTVVAGSSDDLVLAKALLANKQVLTLDPNTGQPTTLVTYEADGITERYTQTVSSSADGLTKTRTGEDA